MNENNTTDEQTVTANSTPAARRAMNPPIVHSSSERNGVNGGRSPGRRSRSPSQALESNSHPQRAEEQGNEGNAGTRNEDNDHHQDIHQENQLGTLKCVSANVQRSASNLGLLLEKHRDQDVIFVQEPYKGFIKVVASTTRAEGDQYFHTSAHRNFVCLGYSENTRALIYVNKKWSHTSPRLRTDVINHNDVVCITMRMGGEDLTFINVYNDSKKFEAVEYLTQRSEAIPKICCMAGDFNLRDPMWDAGERVPGVQSRHLAQRELLIELAKEQLGLSLANNPRGPATWLSNNLETRDGVLDLVWVDSERGTQGRVYVDDVGRGRSDHAVLVWQIPVILHTEDVPTIRRGSKEGEEYIRACRRAIHSIPLIYDSREHVERIGGWLGKKLSDLWDKHATTPDKTKHSKSWWNRECSSCMKEVRELRLKRRETAKERREWQRNRIPEQALERMQKIRETTSTLAQIARHVDGAQKKFKSAVRRAKREFFDAAIQRTHKSRIWDLVEWTKPRRVNTTTGLTDSEGRTVEEPRQLAELFQEQFTPTNPRGVDPEIIESIPQLEERSFPPIAENEIVEAMNGTSNFSAPGPDHLSWFWLKRIIVDLSDCECEEADHEGQHVNTIRSIAAYYNACIEYGIHPTIFKKSRTIVIPKPNKKDYTRAKSYRPIVLLNCLGKLLEKVIAKRMQFDAQKFNIIHPCQFGGTIQHGTQDAGIQLVHNIQQAWKRGVDSTALLIDVAQFFPSVHHNLLASILRRNGFNRTLCTFFDDYLVGRQTQFLFNGHCSEPTDFSTGVGQGSALSPVLTGLYLAPVMHIVAPVGERLGGNANATLQFFVDDGLIHVAGKLGPTHDRHDGLSYNVIAARQIFEQVVTNLNRLGLSIEGDKLELMHFRRAKEKEWTAKEPLGPSLKVRIDGERHIIKPKTTMRYLGFYLDPKLTFKEHVRFYATKAASTIQAMKMLGNSVRGLSPKDKRRLYISNAIPVMAYGAQLWWNPQWKGRKWIAQTLQKVQNKGARWISGGFRTTPTGALEMMAGVIPIKYQINKFMEKAGLRSKMIHDAHPIKAHFPPDKRPMRGNKMYNPPMPLEGKKSKDSQSPIAIMAEIGAKSSETSDTLHDECRPGDRVMDVFEERVMCHMDNIEGRVAPPKSEKDELNNWINQCLNPLINAIERERSATMVFTDGSQKKDRNEREPVRAGGAWMVLQGGRTVKGNFGCGQATPYDAEMMALARGIKEATRVNEAGAKSIHVFADNKAALKSILRANKGPAQITSIAACEAIRRWLEADQERSVHLWWCPGHRGVYYNTLVDREAGAGAEIAQETISFAYARQRITAKTYADWKKDMRSTAYRGKRNLIRTEKDLNKCKHTASNWFLKVGGNDNAFFARVVRFISGHFPHGEYRERFNLEGRRECCCGKGGLETREHIWYDCKLWIRKHEPKIPEEEGEGDSEEERGRRLERRERRRRDALDFRSITPEGMSRREYEYKKWRDTPMELEEVVEFLKMNPAVASFHWSEAVDRAEEDWTNGLRDTENIFRKKLHSEFRKKAHKRWLTRHPDQDTKKFNLIYAVTALEQLVKREEASEANYVDKAVEFGVSRGEAIDLLKEFKQERRQREKEEQEQRRSRETNNGGPRERLEGEGRTHAVHEVRGSRDPI